MESGRVQKISKVGISSRNTDLNPYTLHTNEASRTVVLDSVGGLGFRV